MIFTRVVLALVWFTSQLGVSAADSPVKDPAPFARLQVDCEAILDRLVQEEDWIDRILDPQITTEAALAERLEFYSTVHTCLSDTPNIEQGVDAQTVNHFVEYFLIFVGGYDTFDDFSTLQLVDLAQSDDPAVVALRDEAGLAPPDGYVYVRFYKSRGAMPALVRAVFDPNTAGVTMFTRYIAIPHDETGSWETRLLQSLTLTTTTSHELVHAYVNAALGLAELKTMPDWYAEGIATYLSGSGEDHTVVGPDQRITTTTSQEYRQYKNNFAYLENELGRARLLELIRLSIEQVDPSIVYRDLGYETDQAFLEGAAAYWERRLYLTGGAIVLVIALLGWWALRRMPEVRCENCDHTGKRADFANGYCPECYYPFRE